MTRIHFILLTTLLMASLLLTGCGMRTPPPPPVMYTLPPAPTATPIATIEPVSPTGTAKPQPVSSVLFRDDFNGALGEGWTWMSEYPTSWSLTAVPRTLQIMAGSGYVNSGSMTNVLLRPIPEGNFEAVTLLAFRPRRNFQFAGLIIYESNSRFLQAGRGFCSTESICSGDGLYFDYYHIDSFERENFDHQYAGGTSVYLRVQREERTYTFLASPDGFVWQEIGGWELDIAPVSIGLLAGQNTRESIPANFDFFEVRSLP